MKPALPPNMPVMTVAAMAVGARYTHEDSFGHRYVQKGQRVVQGQPSAYLDEQQDGVQAVQAHFARGQTAERQKEHREDEIRNGNGDLREESVEHSAYQHGQRQNKTFDGLRHDVFSFGEIFFGKNSAKERH